jgi:hypothetical protein
MTQPIQMLAIVISVTALAGSMISPAFSKTHSRTNHGKPPGRHRVVHWNDGPGYVRPAHGSWPATQPQNSPGNVCPEIGRAFDCKIWPPPIDQDPDRKTGSGDSG